MEILTPTTQPAGGGEADTAVKLSSARTFELTGDVTGTVDSDLENGVSIAAAIGSGVIVDADVNASAAIAGTKISTDFGSQTVQTTGPVIVGKLGAGGANYGTAGQILTSQGADAAPTWEDAGGGAASTVAGTNTQIQYNDNGSFGASSDFTWNDGSKHFTVNGEVYIPDGINHIGDTDTKIRFPADNTVSIETGGTEHFRIDSGGRLLSGVTSTTSSANAVVQGAPGTGILLVSRSTDTPGADVGLGRIRFSDSNHDHSAEVEAVRDGGTWTSGVSQPTRLEFSVTPDGASNTVEALRISSAGAIGLAGANFGTSGQVLTSSGSAAAPAWTTLPTSLAITSSTVAASGTGNTFDSLPSGLRRVNLTFNGLSTSLGVRIGVRIGGSGGLVATGYNLASCFFGGGYNGFFNTNDSLFGATGWADASNIYNGSVEIVRHSSTATTTNVIYFLKLTMNLSGFNYIHIVQGHVVLPTELTQVRMMPESGNFDAGSIEIDYLS